MIDGQKLNYEFGEFRLDVMKRQLWRDGEVVPLYSKAFDLLLVLVQKSGSLLTKDELLETVWPGQILEEANLTVTMSAIRKALGEKAAQPRYIVNIPGRGYRFVAPLQSDPLGTGAVVIESETIAQITVEQETEDEDDLSMRTPILLGGATSDTSAALIAAEPQVTSLALAAQKSRSVFRRPWVVAGVVALAATAMAASVYLVRKIQQERFAASHFTNVQVKQITNNGRIANATISPDGKFFAFVQTEKDMQSLRVGQMNGEPAIQLLPAAAAVHRDLRYSSDGSYLYYARQDEGQKSFVFYRLAVLGGAPEKLRDEIAPYFDVTRDGSRVAFVTEDRINNNRRLSISDLNGANEIVLLTLPAEQLGTRAVAWSPDNSMVAVGAGDSTQPNQSIRLIQTASGALSSLTPPVWRDISHLVWLNDGSGLVVIAAGADPDEGRQVWFVTYPRGEIRRLTHDFNIYDYGVSVAADSNSLLLVQQQQIVNIWAGPADDFGKAKQITFTALNPTSGNMSFDWLLNDHLVYASSPGHGLNLWTMDAGGQNSREITSPGNNDSIPSATADGRYVVFASTRSGADDIWRADSDGTNARQLTKCGKNYQPSVSPDGKWVVYVGACDGVGALWRVPLEGGEPVRLTDRSSMWPWVSPDSKWVACAYRATLDKFQLAIVPIEGGPPVKVLDVAARANFNFGIRWTPDGKAVTYRNWGTGLWRQNVDGGPPERLPGLPEEKIACYGWSRDGKLFAFGRQTEIRDVVLLKDSK